MARVLAAAALVVVAGAASADEVYLRSGGRLTGEVVQRTAEVLILEAEPGRITLPASYVVRVVTGPSDLSLFRERAGRLANDDVGGWLALARWARERGLLTAARQAFEHVTTVDPANATAHQALGHVLMDGRWVSQEESYRARGYVFFEGAWMRPEQMQASLAQRAAEAEAERARAESDARVREADARARVAEAEARRLEAEARQAEAAPDGIPYSFVLAGGGPFGPYAPFASGPGFIVGPAHPTTVVVKVRGGSPPACPRPTRHMSAPVRPSSAGHRRTSTAASRR
jgi:hypothetical protein